VQITQTKGFGKSFDGACDSKKLFDGTPRFSRMWVCQLARFRFHAQFRVVVASRTLAILSIGGTHEML
jgi:hypothetical protein